MRRNTPSNKLIRGSRCPCPIGGSRRACGAGRASSRRAEQSSRHGQQAGGQASVPVGRGRAWPGFETTRQANDQQPSAGGVEATAGPAGPGRGAGGRRQDQGGPSGRAKLRPLWRPPQGLRGLASVPVGGGRARADYPTALSTVGMEAAAGPAGPGRASRRRAERSSRRGRRAGGQAPRRPEIRQCHKRSRRPAVPQAPPESQNSS